MKKSFLQLTLIFLFMMGGVSVALGQGSGTQGDPYLVASLPSSIPANTYYKLTANSSHGGNITVGSNAGVDGDDYTITLTGTNPLFTTVTGASGSRSAIKNINLIANGTFTRGILARDVYYADIRNCRIDALTGAPTVNGSDAGGLIGNVQNSTVVNCRSKAVINGGIRAGGLIGNAVSTTIDQCFATGDVTTDSTDCGGLIGSLTGAGSALTNSYALGNVVTNVSWGDIGPTRTSRDNCTVTQLTGACGPITVNDVSPWGATATYWDSPNIKQANCGGLVGNTTANVTNCYAIGNVTATGVSASFPHGWTNTTSNPHNVQSSDCGYYSDPPTNSIWVSRYSTGTCTYWDRDATDSRERRPVNIGTLVGNNNGAVMTSVRASGTLTGRDRYIGQRRMMGNDGVAGQAIDTVQLATSDTKTLASYPAGWSIGNACTWTMIDGKTYPIITANLVDSCLKNDIKTYYNQLCSRYQYTVTGTNYTMKGAMDYYPGGMPATLNYYYNIQLYGNDNFFNSTEGRAYSKVGNSKYGISPYDEVARGSDLVDYIPATPKAKLSYVRMWAYLSDGTNTNNIANTTFKNTCTSNWDMATVNPLPTAEWKSYVDPYFNTVTTPLNHKTICYDYRDKGDGQTNVAAQYDSAYVWVELTGTAPFTYQYDKENSFNGVTLGDGTDQRKIQRITGTPAAKDDHDTVWYKAGWNNYSSRYYYNVFSMLPNHVDVTQDVSNSLPLGGSEPRYTGYNLNYHDTVGQGTDNGNFYIMDGVVRTDAPATGCISNSFYAWYDEVITPYKTGSTTTYDTVVVNPLPVMNYPYSTWHSNYDQAFNPALRFAHNDTVVCEGETITSVVFTSPIIERSTFIDSMHYSWQWVTDNTRPAVVPSGDGDYVFPTLAMKPFNPNRIPTLLRYPDTDTIPTVNNDNLMKISDPYSIALSQNYGLDSVPMFNTNDDHMKWIRNNANTGWQYGPGVLRDTISRSYIRVTPYFINYKHGICLAKQTNYGYRDVRDKEYRGVTDYAVTVNPRPFPTVDTAYQVVCTGTRTEKVQLGTQIRYGVDTVWYSIRDYYPSYGMSLEYDSISPVTPPKVNDGSGNGAIINPATPPHFGASPYPSDSIRSFTAWNTERVPITDTVKVIPYFINRKICVGEDTLIRYKINPATVIEYDLIGDTICEGVNEYRLDVLGYGTDVYYEWYYRPTENGTKTLLTDVHRPQYYYDAKKSGFYQVHMIGTCGDKWSKEVSVYMDSLPVWEKDLLLKEQLCAGQTGQLTVDARGAKRYVWYCDGDSIADTNTYTITNAQVGKDYGNYQVKAYSVCGKAATSSLSRLWVVTPLSSNGSLILGDSALINTPSNFEAGKSKQVNVGHSFGYEDVTDYVWKYISSNGLVDNAQFSTYSEGSPMHSPYVKFAQEDKGIISVDLYHACSPTGYYSAYKNITVSPSTGIDGTDVKAVVIYPNPVNSELNVMSESAIESIIVTDINGRTIYTQHDVKQNAVSVAAGTWPKGAYIVTVKNATETVVNKVVKN